MSFIHTLYNAVSLGGYCFSTPNDVIGPDDMEELLMGLDDAFRYAGPDADNFIACGPNKVTKADVKEIMDYITNHECVDAKETKFLPDTIQVELKEDNSINVFLIFGGTLINKTMATMAKEDDTEETTNTDNEGDDGHDEDDNDEQDDALAELGVDFEDLEVYDVTGQGMSQLF